MKEIDGIPVGSFGWPVQRCYDYAMDRATKLIDRYPLLSEIWLKEADRLRLLVENESSTSKEIS